MFRRKPYEYDIHKKGRRRLIVFLLFSAIVISALLYYLNVYGPENTQYIEVTERPNSTTWIDVPFYKSVEAPIKSTKNNRDPVRYYNVIAQFDVETTFRYQKNADETYCNIFVWDVMLAMDTILPHYYDRQMLKAGEDDYIYTGSANVRAHFLETRGTEYGWKEISAKDAQERANFGYPTFAIWKNSDASEDEYGVPAHRPSGHMMVIRPSPTGVGYRWMKGPYIAQAGKVNTMNLNVTDVLNVIKRNDVKYYTHD